MGKVTSSWAKWDQVASSGLKWGKAGQGKLGKVKGNQMRGNDL